ncbi:MAG: imidazole glycerol phosphate synthase subunit HisH [Thermonemataceae bacterium]
MQVAIIKYNAGNIQSVIYALNRLGINPTLTDEPEKILAADKVIFPGVGEASTAMQYLKGRQLDQVIKKLKQPILGICLGLQLMCSHSEENDTTCLGIFKQQVKKFNSSSHKVPHIGWNSIMDYKSSLFDQLVNNAFVYYVHSFYAEVGEHTIAQTDYVLPFSAALQRDNFQAVQFHPEKSGQIGEQILKNFLTQT